MDDRRKDQSGIVVGCIVAGALLTVVVLALGALVGFSFYNAHAVRQQELKAALAAEAAEQAPQAEQQP
jgi:predicted negative regulator of RcsB-dependent stress response